MTAGPAPAAPVVQVVPHATTFIRGPALELARLVPRLELQVRHNPLAEAAALGARSLEPQRWEHKGAGQEWPANVEVHRLSVPSLRRDGANPGLGLRVGRHLTSRLEGRQVALLHGHFLHPEGVAAAEAAKRRGLPLVVTGHGFDVYDLPGRSGTWRDLVVRTLDAADAVTTVSERNAALLSRLGVPARKLSVIPNGFDPRLFHPADREAARRAVGVPSGRRLLLSVGNLVPVKGHADLLGGLATLLRADRDLLLAIVGSGPLEEALRRKADGLGIGDQVLWPGRRPHSEIPHWMNAADLFVLPSHAEGCVTVVQEALGCGLPVVATAVGQVPDVLTPANGLQVARRDPEALGRAVEQALGRTYDRARIARDAQGTTWAANAERTFAVYRSLAPALGPDANP